MPSKIKVLQVIPKLGYGGAETGCYDFAHYLHEKDFGSYIVTSGGDLLKYVNKKKVKVIRLPVHSKNPLLILINTIILSLIILVLNINIVHARSRAPAWSSYLATKLTRRKFVTTFHGTYNFKSSLKKYYNYLKLNALKFLKDLGDPYEYLTRDSNGKQSVNFGIYGIPESILIDNKLTIIKKFLIN